MEFLNNRDCHPVPGTDFRPWDGFNSVPGTDSILSLGRIFWEISWKLPLNSLDFNSRHPHLAEYEMTKNTRNPLKIHDFY